jgi:hypothetical protein
VTCALAASEKNPFWSGISSTSECASAAGNPPSAIVSDWSANAGPEHAGDVVELVRLGVLVDDGQPRRARERRRAALPHCIDQHLLERREGLGLRGRFPAPHRDGGVVVPDEHEVSRPAGRAFRERGGPGAGTRVEAVRENRVDLRHRPRGQGEHEERGDQPKRAGQAGMHVSASVGSTRADCRQ